MALDDDIALLSRVTLLGSMDREALRLLAFSAETRHLRAGDTLYRKGDISDGGFVIASGTVALVEDDTKTADAVVGPGTLIGEIALITETRRPTTAVAREPTTVLRISRSMFRRTLEEYPQMAQRIATDLRARVRTLSSELGGVKRVLKQRDK
jgi:CRP-like cAMP-binding protein